MYLHTQLVADQFCHSNSVYMHTHKEMCMRYLLGDMGEGNASNRESLLNELSQNFNSIGGRT